VLGLDKEGCNDSAGTFNIAILEFINVNLYSLFYNTVKKAYYKQSLKVHPDRVTDDEKENATEKFQTLGKVYSILSDKEKRKIYDETGKFYFETHCARFQLTFFSILVF
jgi:hypothetical protein